MSMNPVRNTPSMAPAVETAYIRPTMFPVTARSRSVSLMTRGETIPIMAAGVMKSMVESRTIRSSMGVALTHAGASCASGSISSVAAAPASSMIPRLVLDAARSASIPPSQFPMLIPASITPMTLVQVYTDTPMCGASILAATISMMSVTALAMNTMRYGSRARMMRSGVFPADSGVVDIFFSGLAGCWMGRAGGMRRVGFLFSSGLAGCWRRGWGNEAGWFSSGLAGCWRRGLGE